MTLAVHGVRVGYGSSEVLRDVTLDLPPGSFLAVVGPNGSGKSTLIRTLARALSPSAGTATLDGRNVSDWRPKPFARRVAVVSQEGSPAFDYTAREAVGLGRAPYESRLSPDPKASEAIERAMREVGVWDLRDRPMSRLSGGERRLVALARALAQEPEVLLLDEPTNHLDIRHQVEFLEALRRLNSGGVSVLMVVHDLNLAARYAGRVVVLSRGKVRAAGVPSVALAAEVVREVFETPVEVGVSSRSGEIRIQPLASQKKVPEGTSVAHVICGSGSGAFVMRRFYEENVRFSCGVLSAEDADYAVARALGAVVIEGLPFCPIPDEAHARNVAAARSARLVVVCRTPFGPANVKNLLAAAEARKSGATVLLLRANDHPDPSLRERDYTGGEAEKVLEMLMNRGAGVGTEDDALALLGVREKKR